MRAKTKITIEMEGVLLFSNTGDLDQMSEAIKEALIDELQNRKVTLTEYGMNTVKGNLPLENKTEQNLNLIM